MAEIKVEFKKRKGSFGEDIQQNENALKQFSEDWNYDYLMIVMPKHTESFHHEFTVSGTNFYIDNGAMSYVEKYMVEDLKSPPNIEMKWEKSQSYNIHKLKCFGKCDRIKNVPIVNVYLIKSFDVEYYYVIDYNYFKYNNILEDYSGFVYPVSAYINEKMPIEQEEETKKQSLWQRIFNKGE